MVSQWKECIGRGWDHMRQEARGESKDSLGSHQNHINPWRGQHPQWVTSESPIRSLCFLRDHSSSQHSLKEDWASKVCTGNRLKPHPDYNRSLLFLSNPNVFLQLQFLFLSLVAFIITCSCVFILCPPRQWEIHGLGHVSVLSVL